MLRPICAALVLMLGACTSWPDEGRGGFAERRPANEPRLGELANRFEQQRVRGAEIFAAGLSDEARVLFIRAQRNHRAGILDDAEIDLIRLQTLLDGIDQRLNRKS